MIIGRQDDERGLIPDLGAVIDDTHIALLAPVGAPAVAHDPVSARIVPSDESHHVIDGKSAAIVEDPATVTLHAVTRSDRYCYGAVLVDGAFDLIDRGTAILRAADITPA